jgi:membrane protein implicated in regulation of membrane protease activity
MLQNPFFLVFLFCFVVVVVMVLMGHDGGEHDVPHDAGHAEAGFPNFLTIRSLLLFGVGFGGAGFIANNKGYSTEVAIVVGLIFGVGIAFAGLKFLRIFQNQEGNTVTRLSSLEGSNGSVTTAIPSKGFGEIVARNEFGSPVTLMARSESGEIPAGTRVRILSIDGGIATVTPALSSANS